MEAFFLFIFPGVRPHRHGEKIGLADPSAYSTMDHLHSINQLIEKSNEYNMDIYLALVDFNKAFDSIHQSSIIQGLDEKTEIDKLYVNIRAAPRTAPTSYVNTDRNSRCLTGPSSLLPSPAGKTLKNPCLAIVDTGCAISIVDEGLVDPECIRRTELKKIVAARGPRHAAHIEEITALHPGETPTKRTRPPRYAENPRTPSLQKTSVPNVYKTRALVHREETPGPSPAPDIKGRRVQFTITQQSRAIRLGEAKIAYNFRAESDSLEAEHADLAKIDQNRPKSDVVF
ncbi:hypothetical protein M8J75_013286 [Diaphorina citri]|nr:hypothetical protein M8J75_013286 [Diaphorina citri]